MKSHDIRKAYIEYFKKHSHSFVESSATVPHDDPTLLFTNAGMNQFKNTFLGAEKRPYQRAVSSQKCVRAGGKHNDLEEVGHTARHHTFFEMMGNFSFGDYFKKEAIHYAWDLLTNEIGFDKNRLYVTVFNDDDEAAEIWHKQENVPKDRIFRFGEKDNFWRMGDVGPCGPSSEIFFDHGDLPGEEPDPYKNIAAGGDRFVEIWNLVFMQFNESANGKMEPLPNPSIDTGGGLERWTAALQGRPINYDTDLFYPLLAKASHIAGIDYAEDPNDRPTDADFRKKVTAMRVLADHARTTAFLIADGVIPSNEGRGYVLRRILRRAIRYGRSITDQSLLPALVDVVIKEMGPHFQELNERATIIQTHAREEEQRFLTTLDTGTELLSDTLKTLNGKGQKVVPGETVFKLYDTFGFPADLTQLMAEENGFQIDVAGFETEMEKAKQKARASWKGQTNDEDRLRIKAWAGGFKETEFLGYEFLESECQVLSIHNGKEDIEELQAGETGFVILDKTPFYAESGGQTADTGEFTDSSTQATIFDCQKEGTSFVHSIRITSGSLKKGQIVHAKVDAPERREIANHHSATHLMHAALRNVLGEHVTQAGSLVEKDRLRFDYTHNQPLTREQQNEIESQVNRQIALAHPVQSQLMNKDDAVSAGALALFGEKYDDEVRVITMGSYSVELCGGTHVSNTSQIRLFVIVNESGVSSGVRRIEALTGSAAMDFLLKHRNEHLQALASAGAQQNWIQFVNNEKEKMDLSHWIEDRKGQIRDLQKQVKAAKSSQLDPAQLVDAALEFTSAQGAGRFVHAQVDEDDRKVLSDMVDKIKDRLDVGVVILAGKGDKSSPLLVSVTKNLNPGINAGKILKELATKLGGKGGGRPDFAQGAVPHLENWNDVVMEAFKSLG